MQKVTLLIDKRKEQSVKYKKLLTNEDVSVIISQDLISALKFIQDKEPDLIIISDSIGQNLPEYCNEIRALTYNMRPIIIALSKSAEITDKLAALEKGADDFISEPINSEEFKMRIKAHLRREFETNIDLKNGLPNKSYSLRALKRAISSSTDWAALLITIDNLNNYKEIYTKLASDKLIQSYTAIIGSTLMEEDYLGNISDNEFLVITNSLKSEKIANFLIFAFDTVAEKFYSAADVNRGFIITQSETKAEKRSEFIHTTIGIVTSQTRNYKEVSELLSDLINIRNLAKHSDKSNYLIERTKLSGNDSIIENKFNNKVVIIEKDEALVLLLSTILNLQGYEVEISDDISSYSNAKPPAVIILDAGDIEEKNGIEICKQIRNEKNFDGTKIIMTSSFHEKESILKAGADLYLPKPYETSELVNWISLYINEVNF